MNPLMGNGLRSLRLARGWTHDRAATEMGVSRGQFIKLERGERGLTERTLKLAAKAFDVPRATVLGDDTVESEAVVEGSGLATAAEADQLMRVDGEVAAGRWIEIDDHVDEARYDPAPITPDPRWSREAQYGLVVRGTSINQFAVDGDILHCIDIGATGLMPVNEDLVIVEQTRDGGHLRERTAKLYHVGENDMVELRADSDDPRWGTPIHVPHRVYSHAVEPGLTVAIVAIVVGAYRPRQVGRRR